MKNRYVLITAAKDEEACIGEVLERVVRQTIRPVAWFIIDDGSTDRTAAIIQSFAEKHSFIHLHSAGSREGRNFGSQYKAIMAGCELAQSLDFAFLGVTDADQAPEPADYYEVLLQEFHNNPRLGVASGYVFERPRGVWEPRRGNARDSAAASALFRRTCFEEIGGYTPLVHGGSDWLIQLKAKMVGWEIQVRTDLPILHYRPTSSAGGIWRGLFRAGLMDASFGSHAGFEFLKCCRRIPLHPFLFGSVVRYCGFLWWKLARRKPLIPTAAVATLRKEQRAKLRAWALGSRAPAESHHSTLGG